MTRRSSGIRWGSWGKKTRWPSRYTINLGRLLRIHRGSRCSVLNLIDGVSEKGRGYGVWLFYKGGLKNLFRGAWKSQTWNGRFEIFMVAFRNPKYAGIYIVRYSIDTLSKS